MSKYLQSNLEVEKLGDEYRCHDRHRDACGKEDRCDPCDPCNPCDPCDHHDNDWDWGSWLPIIILVIFLAGGLDWFGGSDKDCCDRDGGSGSWLLILLILFLFWQGNQDDKKKGGFGIF